MQDYYSILGIEKGATSQQISDAYRQKARALHPDVNPDPAATEEFKKVTEAFDTLNHPEKRAVYDRGGPTPNFGPNFGFHGFNVDMGDFFGHRGPMGRERGRDTKINVSISFYEAALGCKKDVVVKGKKQCTCDNGVVEWNKCQGCDGSGRKTIQQNPWIMQTTCSQCNGQGRTPKKQCENCKGSGYVNTEDETISVEIPPGIDDGMALKVAGKGDIGGSGRRGDLVVIIAVAPDEVFGRNGSDLLCRVPVSYTDLVFGTKLEIPTLSGTANVDVNPGTTPGKKLRLGGMGIRDIRNPMAIGDMYVMLDLEIPINMDSNYKKTLLELKEFEKNFIGPKKEKWKQKNAR